jgi:hypothetical protein
MIDRLAALDGVFGERRKLGPTRASANERFCRTPADVAELMHIFDQSRAQNDLLKTSISKLGFSFGCWNGLDSPHSVGMRMRCGAYGDFPRMPNDLTIGVPDRSAGSAAWTTAKLRLVLTVMIDAWEPAEAALLSWPYLDFAPRGAPEKPGR